MSVDKETVVKIAKLSRIAINDAEAETMVSELNGILGWVEQLGEVDVTGVAPMASVIANKTKMRTDIVTDDLTGGGITDKVLANAPAKEGVFFGVPKVIE
ncbi:Asp-tRNA(Asn)/Glu-tRNA(Gln) amidotransferase subunit GatC [Sphingorhabdus arenilitoris]|uniref:Aspartyl/glutamyl-tRNA(Asn/Gln) amidotransferase subunit C n=1 Tax=Sphingorhabdus arenilitoris TaxID=1490041 RepID=A0ABV8RGV2_9SPHN